MLVLVCCRRKSKGDGQECPSRTSPWLEHTGVVFLKVDLVGVFVLPLGFLRAIGCSQSAAFRCWIAADLVMKRRLFGFEMRGSTRSELAAVEFGGAMPLADVLGCGGALLWMLLTVLDRAVPRSLRGGSLGALRDNSDSQRGQAGRQEHIF